MELSAFEHEVRPAPPRVLAAVARGARTDGGPFGLADVPRLLHDDALPFRDGVLRNPDGTLVVLTDSDLPGVEPAMVDWWFTWHQPQTARYRLWHPQAHRYAGTSEDRSARADEPGAYVGSVSRVDEDIDGLLRLRIRFVEEAMVGLDRASLAAAGWALAVCARTGLARPPIDAGHLVHLVRSTPQGSLMRSFFLNGDLAVAGPLDRLLHPLLARPALRRRAITDASGAALLRHCSEEMHHFATFLPDLYRSLHAPPP